jgi:hypothetical protein
MCNRRTSWRVNRARRSPFPGIFATGEIETRWSGRCKTPTAGHTETKFTPLQKAGGQPCSLNLIGSHFATWMFWTLCGVFDLGAGLLLGSGLVLKWTLGNDEGKQAMISEKIAKLSPYQLAIGVGQIAMSVLYFVF